MAIPVSDVSVEVVKARLRRTLDRIERIYGISSADMLTAVQAGAVIESGEIALWLVQYRDYLRLTQF